MKLTCLCAVTITVAAGLVLDAQAKPSPIPFEPPVVHRGFDPNSPLWKPQKQNGKFRKPNALFTEEDRRSFKAMHPFLLRETPPKTMRRAIPRKQNRKSRA